MREGLRREVEGAAETLLAEGRLPADALAVLCVGSVPRGWANAYSDIDLNVITLAPVDPVGTVPQSVGLEPPVVPTAVAYVGDRRCEVKFWTDGQVDQMLTTVRRDPFDGQGGLPGQVEELFLERLLTCYPVRGEDWLAARVSQLRESAFLPMAVERSLAAADSAVEDALGQLAAEDLESAVLSARRALGHAVDGLLESHGCFGSAQPKWRARRFRETEPPELGFEDYWRLETMRGLDPDDQGRWVREVVDTCRALIMGVEIE